MEPDYTQSDVTALADAMWQMLDDMRRGVYVSVFAKVEARIAYEPFRDKSEPEYSDWLTYDEAVAMRKKMEGSE